MVEPRVSQRVDAQPGSTKVMRQAVPPRHCYRDRAGRDRRSTAVLAVFQHGDASRRHSESSRRLQIDLRMGFAFDHVFGRKDEAEPSLEVES